MRGKIEPISGSLCQSGAPYGARSASRPMTHEGDKMAHSRRATPRARDIACAEQEQRRRLAKENPRSQARRVAEEALRQRHRLIVERLELHGANVAAVARELGLKWWQVRAVRDAEGMGIFVGAGPRVTGDRMIERTAVAAALARSEGNVKRVVRETGVPETTVRRWKPELWSPA